MMVLNEKDVEVLLEFINCNEILAYDTETTGLSVRKDTVIGFGVSNADTGFYVPCFRWCTDLQQLVPYGPYSNVAKKVLKALSHKKLLTWNASFDTRITKANFGISLLASVYADVLLMKHTCDEEPPFALKDVGAAIYGQDVKEEKKEMQASIKANGGTSSQYFKTDVGLLSRYCVQDCLLTYKLFNHYSRELRAQGLEDFYYKDEVMPLYTLVTIPMEEQGLALDMPKLAQAQLDIAKALQELEAGIQQEISPMLATFLTWFLNKDYPLLTYTGKVPAWTKKHASQYEAWCFDNPDDNMFNLQSKHHLKKLFFDTLNETPLSRTPTGLPQVDEDFLESIKHKHAWVAKLIDLNKLNKIKSTYIDRLLEEQEEGIFYASFAQHRTVSGRYAGDAQQLPRPLEPSQASEAVVYFNNLIREFIVPKPGNLLISADYQQLEPSIFAHTSGDTGLQRIFIDGTDFYSTVAIQTLRLVNLSDDKAASNYLGKLYPSIRQAAKKYALGIAYGMTGYKLKFELGCTEEQAETLVNQYLAAFPKLQEAMNDRRGEAKNAGMVRAPMGRVRHMPQAKAIFDLYGPCIDNDLELWKRYHTVPSVYAEAKRARRTYKNLLNNALNFPIQSTAASVINRAAIALAKQGLVPVCQVHDELIFDTPAYEALTISGTIKQVMENVVKLSVPLRTEPKQGVNYRQCK